MPLFLQDLLDYIALQEATLTLSGVMLSGVLSPPAGKLSDQFNPQLLLCSGFLIEVATIIWAQVVRAVISFVFPSMHHLALRTLVRAHVAFKIAGSIAFKGGVKRAGGMLLEPMMDVEVVTPYATDLLSLSQGRAKYTMPLGCYREAREKALRHCSDD